MNKMACLVLAAGQGARFGFKKQLVTIDKKPMINKVLMELKPIFNDDLFVVVGAFKDEVVSVVDDLAHPIINDDWSNGIGSSISVGVTKINNKANYNSLLIALADQIWLKKIDYKFLISKFDGCRVVATKYENFLGVPSVFPFSYFEKLILLSDENGAKSILNNESHSVLGVSLFNRLEGIDTVDDLETYLGFYKQLRE